MTNNYELSYEELLDLTNEMSPHQRFLNSVTTEVYKCLNELSTDIMNIYSQIWNSGTILGTKPFCDWEAKNDIYARN